MKRLLPLFLALLCVVCCAPIIAVEADDTPFHAPYFSTWWENTYDQIIDVIQVDWRCTVEAPGTYWACLSWEIRNPGVYNSLIGGYAGFQTLENGERVVLMSNWNQNSKVRPKIEYVKGGTYGTFGGEGVGKQIFTDYHWKPDTWYTMRIQFRDSKNKTFVEQWIKEKKGDWELLSMMSYPFPGVRMSTVGGFQEDFALNNERRSQRIKNAYFRLSPSKQWIPNRTFAFENVYMMSEDDSNSPWIKSDMDNVNFDCNWGQKKDYLWVETGGRDFTPIGKYLPMQFYLDSPQTPKDKKFLNSKDYLNEMTMESVINIFIDWQADQVYDIVTEDFALTKSSGSTIYRLFNFPEGHLSYWDDPDGNVLLLGLANTEKHNAETIWINPQLDTEESESDWGRELRIDYTLETKKWYNFRIQTWEKDKKTLYGYWMRPKGEDWTLLGILAYPERNRGISYPMFSTESYGGTDLREFRLKKAYGKRLDKKKWDHWEYYQVSNYFARDTADGNDKRPCMNVENNIKTGRHKNGYVWCRFGGEEWKHFDRHYPFRFRIKGEKDKPKPGKFIEDGIPKKYRP